MTAPRVVRPAAGFTDALTVHRVEAALENCETPECTRVAVWAVNYSDAAAAMPVPARSCGLHLAATAHVLAQEARA